jgi:hypothetical protein
MRREGSGGIKIIGIFQNMLANSFTCVIFFKLQDQRLSKCRDHWMLYRRRRN